MSVDSFYSTTSQISFTLLGFWWAVVQFRYEDWSGNPARRRMAHVVSLLFLLPGVMSLMSMLAGDVKIIWRAVFGLAGLLGLVATTLIVTGTKDSVSRPWLRAGSLFVAAPLYLLVTIFALAPELAVSLTGLQPLQLEGILLTLLVFLGVNLAWFLFWEGKRKEVTVEDVARQEAAPTQRPDLAEA